MQEATNDIQLPWKDWGRLRNVLCDACMVINRPKPIQKTSCISSQASFKTLYKVTRGRSFQCHKSRESGKDGFPQSMCAWYCTCILRKPCWLLLCFNLDILESLRLSSAKLFSLRTHTLHTIMDVMCTRTWLIGGMRWQNVMSTSWK